MRDIGKIVLWGFGGVIWGAVILIGSSFVVGGGHGWVSPLPFALLAVLTTPLATIAWARRGTNGKTLAAVTLGIAVIADVLLVTATLVEGTEYVYKVLPAALVWILLWSSWQVLAIFVLLSKRSINYSER